MKLFTSLKYLAGLVAAIVAWFGLAGQARAVFTLSGTAAELVSRGINADFEAPAQARCRRGHQHQQYRPRLDVQFYQRHFE